MEAEELLRRLIKLAKRYDEAVTYAVRKDVTGKKYKEACRVTEALAERIADLVWLNDDILKDLYYQEQEKNASLTE